MRAVLQGIALGVTVSLLATTNLRATILSSQDVVARSIADHRAELGVAQTEERHHLVNAKNEFQAELRHAWNRGVFCVFTKLSSWTIRPPSSR